MLWIRYCEASQTRSGWYSNQPSVSPRERLTVHRQRSESEFWKFLSWLRRFLCELFHAIAGARRLSNMCSTHLVWSRFDTFYSPIWTGAVPASQKLDEKCHNFRDSRRHFLARRLNVVSNLNYQLALFWLKITLEIVHCVIFTSSSSSICRCSSISSTDNWWFRLMTQNNQPNPLHYRTSPFFLCEREQEV